MAHHTTDDNKKAVDHNAIRQEKNLEAERNRQAGKKSYSKKTDHK